MRFLALVMPTLDPRVGRLDEAGEPQFRLHQPSNTVRVVFPLSPGKGQVWADGEPLLQEEGFHHRLIHTDGGGQTPAPT